uniref:SH2 domain containing 1A n=1 Tax=Monodon monoceros TaxID=40151 RepID=A0A8C6CAM7_MONMO
MNREREVFRQVDNILLFGRSSLFFAHLAELGGGWLTRVGLRRQQQQRWHLSAAVPRLGPPKSSPGHGGGGCVSWQNQPGDGGEAPACHGSGRQLFAEGQRERPGSVLPVCSTAPGVHKRFFRKIKNLISAFQKPDQGIVIPLQYPVEKKPSARSTQGATGRREDPDVFLKAP